MGNAPTAFERSALGIVGLLALWRTQRSAHARAHRLGRPAPGPAPPERTHTLARFPAPAHTHAYAHARAQAHAAPHHARGRRRYTRGYPYCHIHPHARARTNPRARSLSAARHAPQLANLGTDFAQLARYSEAAHAYDTARRLGLPWRMLWYQFQPFRAYFQVGRYQEVLALADATLATTPDVEELHYWRARALFMLGARDDAIKAARKAILLNPNYTQAQAFLSKLENSE